MADPIPNAGTQTDPAEYRRLLSREFTPGVISGMVLSAGSGLTLSVSAGNVAVGDANAVTFLPFPAATSLQSLAPNATTTVYATYRATGDLQAFLTTSVPTGTPYEVVGTAVTNATGVVSVDNSTYPATTSGKRHRSEPPTMVGQYHSTQAKITSPLGVLVPNVLDVPASGAPNAPEGVRLGATTQATKRLYVRTHRSAGLSVPNGTWTPIPWNVDQIAATDYEEFPKPHTGATTSTTTQRRFYAGPTGVYTISGRAQFDEPASGAIAGYRNSRVVRYNSAGTPIWVLTCDTHRIDTTPTSRVWFEATLDMSRGDWLEVEVYQTQGATLPLLANNYSGSIPVYATFSLVQVL
jgi:hypothetical protein